MPSDSEQEFWARFDYAAYVALAKATLDPDDKKDLTYKGEVLSGHDLTPALYQLAKEDHDNFIKSLGDRLRSVSNPQLLFE